MMKIANKVLKGTSEASEEENVIEVAIIVGQFGVDVGLDLVKYGVCKKL